MKDTDLIKGFVYERLGHLWPASGYGIFWSIMRGAYHVSMSLVLVLMIDYIWEDAGSQAQGGGGIADDQRQRQILGVDESVFYAAVCCVYVAGATVLHSYTENWIVTYAKFGLVGKQLRDWIVAQLLWADDGRLGLMRAADYLNAGTSEVEAAGMIYDAVFPAVERLAHFFFNVLLILWLSWMATPVILLLIPITVGVQLSRRHATTLVLDQRQRCERQYVASMSDIIENTHTFRSMPSSTIQDLFAVDTSGFGDAHLQAVQFTVVTKERIELIQGMILAAIFFASALMVNSGTLTKGEAVGIIQAFISGSKDIVELSAIAIRMKFNSEGLRMVMHARTHTHTHTCTHTHTHTQPTNAVPTLAGVADPQLSNRRAHAGSGGRAVRDLLETAYADRPAGYRGDAGGAGGSGAGQHPAKHVTQVVAKWRSRARASEWPS